MRRQATIVHVGGNLSVRPIKNRINLERLLLLFGERAFHASARLTTPHAADPDIRPQLAKGPIHRLDLGHHGITIGTFLALLPESAVDGLHPCGMFDKAAAIDQPGRAIIASAGVNLVELDHRGELYPARLMASMIITTTIASA